MNSTPEPTDRLRALTFLEAADFLRDAHFRDGLSVQEIGTALRHMADAADPMVGSLARDGFGLDEIAAMPVAVPPAQERRAALSARLWKIAEHHIIAEWICCEPLDPKHGLCAKGYEALGMAKTLLVDSDPEKAWNPAAPVLDAVLAVADAEQADTRAAALREAADDLATAFGDPTAKHIGILAASYLHRRAREIEAGQAHEERPETPLEKRLRYSERRNDELRTECLRRGKNVLERSEKIVALEREIDGVRRQLGAEILRANEAEAQTAAVLPQPETQAGREAHPSEHTWAAELHDPLAEEWVPGTRYADRDRAANALAHGRRIGSAWKDGTPTERRLVRATTTYTVEVDQQPETVHGCPPDGSGLTPCCGRTPFELPLGDRISSEAPVTCHGAEEQPDEEATR